MPKPPKRTKPTKVKVKQWLKSKGHREKPDKAGDYLDLVAEYHGISAEELKRLING